MKSLFFTLVLAPTVIFACNMQRSLSETQFILDPATGKLKLESIKDNTKIEVDKCSTTEKFILVNFNSIYYQDDTSRLESVTGNLVEKASNCAVQSEEPIQKIEPSFLENLLHARHDFLRKCVRLQIMDRTGQKIQLHAQSTCQTKSTSADGSVVETDGAGCFVAVNPNSRIAMQASINPECLQSSYLTSNQIQAQDVESVIKLWPVSSEAGQLKIEDPIGARYVRHTILPAKDFMPRALKENQDDMASISALATNVSPGQISISSMGRNKILVQPTFFVANLAKDYCKGDQCSKVSSFVAPIAGQLKLTKIDSKTGKKTQVADWAHALKVPANWAGMAEFKSENNLTGLSMGAATIDTSLNEGDVFVLESKFYEPRAFLDDLALTQDFFDLTSSLDVETDEMGADTLPSLPKVGTLRPLPKNPTLPSVGLGRLGVLEFSDRMNSKKAWAQVYDRVCNDQNRNCMRLAGNPFVTLKSTFKIGPNKQVIPMHVSKKSTVFESYEQDVTQFTKKVCQ